MPPLKTLLKRILSSRITFNRQWTSVAVAGIALLAYLALWEEGTPPAIEEWMRDQPGAEQPDAHIETLTTRQFGDSGALQFQIFSPKARHYAKSDSTHFEMPVVDYVDEQSRWRGTSQEGVMFNSNSSVILQRDVVLQQLSRNAKLSTELLWIFIDNNTAVTNAPVTIEANGGKMQGIGMTADFNQQTLKLTSKVQGVYEKQAR